MTAEASSEIRSAVRRLVFASGGRMIPRPIFRDRPGGGSNREEPEPLHAIRAAAALEYEAGQALASAVRYAREDGQAWGEIGAALYPGDPLAGQPAVAAKTFVRFAWQSDKWQVLSFGWTCPACLQTISDHGPDSSGYPSETEEGHTDGCPRLAAAITEYERGRD